MLYKVRKLLGCAAVCYEKKTGSILSRKIKRLENPWLCKLVNLMIPEEMMDGTVQSSAERYLYACHMLNILRSSNHAVVRQQAGNDLTDMIPELEIWQRSDIIQELIKAVELREESASNDIPVVLEGFIPFCLLMSRERCCIV